MLTLFLKTVDATLRNTKRHYNRTCREFFKRDMQNLIESFKNVLLEIFKKNTTLYLISLTLSVTINLRKTIEHKTCCANVVTKIKYLFADICNNRGPSVIILSYPRYCRYRSVMKRLEGVEDNFLRHKLVNALGGFSVPNCNTRILFCRDTFDYPELEGHELLCNHLAPKLKGRPRGKRKKRSLSPGSESNESECSISVASTSSMVSVSCKINPIVKFNLYKMNQLWIIMSPL